MQYKVTMGFILLAVALFNTTHSQNPKIQSDMIEVNLKTIVRASNSLEFQLTVVNKSDQAVFLLTNPTRVNGSEGFYFNVNKTTHFLVEVRSHFFPPPPFHLYSNNTALKLTELMPKGTYIVKIMMSLPLKESAPPYTTDFQDIESDIIRRIQVFIGVIQDDEGVRELLAAKKGLSIYFGGAETLNKGEFRGKMLREVQTIITSPILDVPAVQ